MAVSNTSKGCWTCRDRKIRCGMQRPGCFNCSKTGRYCAGYGVRLSWPDSRGRRAFCNAPLSRRDDMVKPCSYASLHFLNVTEQDTRLSNELLASKMPQRKTRYALSVRKNVGFQEWSPSLPSHISWNIINEQEAPLLNLYLDSGLQVFGSFQGNRLAPSLLRMAMSDSSASSKAILHAMLALSSLHLKADARAFKHEAMAIKLLSESLRQDQRASVAFQHIAASMVLCTYQLCYPSNEYFKWAVHLCGVKQIIMHSLRSRSFDDGDLRTMKDWIFCHEVFTRFALVHCVNHPKWQPSCYAMPISTMIHVPLHDSADNLAMTECSNEVLECILEITNLVYDFQVLSMDRTVLYRRVTGLERRLRINQQPRGVTRTGYASDAKVDMPTVTRLYHKAALMFLEHIRLETFNECQPTFHTDAVNDGLALLASIDIREVPWPFFVIGCEAATDIQREEVLQLLEAERSGDNWPIRRRLIEAFWIQEDLDTTQKLTYVEKMSGVINTLPSLPSFA